MIRKDVPTWLIAGVQRCIKHSHPMTITYVKESGEETVRTIEPYGWERSSKGHTLIRCLDRDTGHPRSFRADRVTAYTVHLRGKRTLDHGDA